jgi:hypothetical protein
MSPSVAGARRIEALGVVIPAREDGDNARRLATTLAAQAGASNCPVVVVVADNGDNGDLSDLAEEEGIEVVEVPTPGPGYARSAGALAVADFAGRVGADPAASWLVSLDADVEVPAGFLESWCSVIGASSAKVISGPSHFAALSGDVELARDVEVVGGWLWGDTALYEHLVGVVNVGGANHAVELASGAANSWYLQPTELRDSEQVIVPGDDWDFGLRARVGGIAVERSSAPLVLTSNRRIAADPVAFLTGRTYERPFVPVREVPVDRRWPPEQDWRSIAWRFRARLVAHFLLKPLLAGIALPEHFDWFCPGELGAAFEAVISRRPSYDGDWNAFRGKILEMCFEEETFELCGRVALHLSGGGQ